MMTLQEQIDFFFAPPRPMQPGPNVSPLHLARREAQDCLFGCVIPEDYVFSNPHERQRMFATMMVVMAGIDLLAKFYAGSDAQGEVGKRIKRFATAFVFARSPRAQVLADVLYDGCRNPLLHSFTLHQTKYSLAMMGDWHPDGSPIRLEDRTSTYVVSVPGMLVALIDAVNSYKAALRGDADLQAKFALMFPSYGSITVGERI